MYLMFDKAEFEPLDLDLLALARNLTITPFLVDTDLPQTQFPEMTDDYSDNTSTTGVVNLGGFTGGMIDFTGDVDWFAVTLTAGEYLEITTYLFDYARADLYDSSGALITKVNTVLGYDYDFIGHRVETSGTYYVSMTDLDLGSDAYLFEAQIFTTDDHGDDNTTRSFLSLDGVTSGTLEANSDQDWFAVTLVAGEELDIYSTVSRFRLYFSLNDADGNEIAATRHLHDSGFTYIADTSGTYYVSAENRDEFQGTNYDYTLTATVGLPDLADNTSTRGVIVLGGSVDSKFHSGSDEDWFAISLTEGQSVDFSLSTVPYLMNVRDASGTYIVGSGASQTLNFTAQSSGTFFIAVQSDTESVENYTLTATESDNIYGTFLDDILRGTADADMIYGSFGDDTLRGLANHDMLYGEYGDDTLLGGGGNDVLNGGHDGADVLDGGTGFDTASYEAAFGRTVVNLITGHTAAFAAGDTLISIENLQGSDYGDVYNGSHGRNTLSGGGGEDMLFGRGGSDKLFGEDGNDILVGGGGSDLLDGGAGNDTLTGGTFTDTFIFTDNFGQDTIIDFTDNVDTINVSGHSGFNSFADIASAASQVGSNVEIVLDSFNTLIIENFSVSDLDVSDFIF